MAQRLLPPLLPGDAIGFISPAGPVTPEQVQPGLDSLRRRGFERRIAPHAFADHGMVSAPAAQRLQDWMDLLKDPRVKAIWAFRGGYGTIQLLNRPDYAFLKKHPRLLIGFSDLTALQWAILQKTGLPALSGLTVTSQVSEENPFVEAGLEILSGRRTCFTAEDFPPGEVQIYREGRAAGLLVGGTLTMINSLCGTPYFLRKKPLILFLEDVNEPLYRIDRCFQQLNLLGFWPRVSGIILGKFLYRDEILDLLPLLLPLLPPGIPVIYNFPYGHFPHCCPLPLGVRARLSTAPLELVWEPFISRRAGGHV